MFRLYIFITHSIFSIYTLRYEVIIGWCQEDLHDQFKQILQQHDCLSCQCSAGSKKKAFLLHQAKALIAAEMTALMQLTDVWSAKKAKEIVKVKHVHLKRMLRRRARKDKCTPILKCGKREFLWLTNEVVKELRKHNKEEKWILRGLRHTAMLARRPNQSTKKLESTEGQEWCKDMPLGKGGKLEQEWVEKRFDWVDESGKPLKPDWTEQSTRRSLENSLRHAACDEYKKSSDICITVDEQEVFDEKWKLLQVHPKARERRYLEVLDKVSRRWRTRRRTRWRRRWRKRRRRRRMRRRRRSRRRRMRRRRRRGRMTRRRRT